MFTDESHGASLISSLTVVVERLDEGGEEVGQGAGVQLVQVVQRVELSVQHQVPSTDTQAGGRVGG